MARHEHRVFDEAPLSTRDADEICQALIASVELATSMAACARDTSGGGVYTGLGGVALALAELSLSLSQAVHAGASLPPSLASPLLDPQHLQTVARDMCRASMGEDLMPSSRRVTMLEGRAGLWALHATLSARLGDGDAARASAAAMEDLYDACVRGLPPSECEVLYGRAGYLAALLACASTTGRLNADIATDIVQHLMCQGAVGAANIGLTGARGAFVSAQQMGFPLMYAWHGSAYLGAVHGVAGIAYVLLCAREAGVPAAPADSAAVLDAVVRCTDALLSQRMPSGNLPSSLGSTRDKLVQLCHGAPGMALLLCKLSTALGPVDGAAYLRAALEASDVVWDRGLLTKGVGLCHGTAGNAYVFLACHRAAAAAGEAAVAQTQLVRAQRFALHAARTWRDKYAIPDRPLSLYEGLAGALVLWGHLLPSFASPCTPVLSGAKMPGFEL